MAGRQMERDFDSTSGNFEGGSSQVFDAWSEQDGGTVRIEVTEAVCVHEGAETASGGRVVLRYASTSVEGCAARF